MFLNTTFPESALPHRLKGMLAFPCALLAALSAGVACADQVIINGVNYTNAKIVQLDQGRLQVRTADGRAVSAWIDEIGLMLVDRGGVFDDFNQAEQFLHNGDAQKAVARYERTLRLTQEFWADLIACRLLAAHDKAGQIDRTAQYFVRIVYGQYSGIGTAARLYPTNFPEKRDGRVARALDLLDDESHKLSDDRKILVDILRFDILARTDPSAARPLAKGIMELAVPAPARTTLIYGVLLRAMKEVARDAPSAVVLAALDRSMQDCPEASLPEFLMLKGQLLAQTAESREEWVHAAWAFLRVPIHMPDHELAPRGLFSAARIMQKLERTEQAKALLSECADHPRMDNVLRKEVERAGESGFE